MKRNIKKVLFAAVLLILLLGCTCSAQAASVKWRKACKAYRTFLTKNVSKYETPEIAGMPENQENYKKSSQFAIVDMNKDGIPELLGWHPVGYQDDAIYVYTYKRGKVTKVSGGPVSLGSGAAGYYLVNICKKGHIHANWNGGWIGSEEYVYRYKSGKVKLFAYGSEISMSGTCEYQLNGKSVSYQKYQKQLKGCKASNVKFYDNTKANRKKYVK